MVFPAALAGIDLAAAHPQTPVQPSFGKGGMRLQKIILVLVGGFLAAPPQAHADTRDDVVSGIERCAVIHDNRVWLDCVYGAVQPMRSQLGLQPAPEFQQRLVPSPQLGTAPLASAAAPAPARTASKPAARRKVGFWENLLGDPPPFAASRMASYSFEKGGGFLVTLENGQQWRQTEVEGGTARWTREASAYEVTIRQGTFGTYFLRTNEGPQIYKVQLVK